jgi:peroxiredoxin
MDELGELEKRHEEFTKRKVRIVAISNDDEATAQISQAALPHLTVVADTQQNLAKAMQVIHAGVGPGGTDTNAPTTLIVDGAGAIRWIYRPKNLAVRATPDELLAAIDTTFSTAYQRPE